MYAPHHTAPGKTQYRTDQNSGNLPTSSVPDPSINLMLGMGIVDRFFRDKCVHVCRISTIEFHMVDSAEQDKGII